MLKSLVAFKYYLNCKYFREAHGNLSLPSHPSKKESENLVTETTEKIAVLE